jgi:hypothetical protein
VNILDGAQIFHGREYFMGANISWARIFHGREYFMGANVSWALGRELRKKSSKV